MNLVILGPPGSGKGTQAALLAASLGLDHLSTGDLLRDEIRSGSELGANARRYMDSGRLVPDEVIIDAVRRRLADFSSNSGFILDGFPRSVPQAVALERALLEASICLPQAVVIQVSEDTLRSRLGGRLTCPQCHATFHLQTKPPREDNVCDECGSGLTRRADEEPEVLRERLGAYARETEPVVSFYRERGALVEVYGDGSIEDVNREILAALRRHRHDTVEE